MPRRRCDVRPLPHAASLIAKHQVSGINPYPNEVVPAASSIKPRLMKVFSGQGGKIYGLPFASYSLGLVCNRDLCTQAGLDTGRGYAVLLAGLLCFGVSSPVSAGPRHHAGLPTGHLLTSPYGVGLDNFTHLVDDPLFLRAWKNFGFTGLCNLLGGRSTGAVKG